MKPLNRRIDTLAAAARAWRDACREAEDFDPDLVDQVHDAIAALAKEARLVVKAAARHVDAADLDVPPASGEDGLAGAATDFAAAMRALEPEWGGVLLEDKEYRAEPEALADAADRVAEVFEDDPDEAALAALRDGIDPSVYNAW